MNTRRLRVVVVLLMLGSACGVSPSAFASDRTPIEPATTITAPAKPKVAAATAAKASRAINNYSCKPARPDSLPIVIVPGGTGTVRDWSSTVLRLSQSGHCVYGRDYGGFPSTLGLINGVASIIDSGKTVAEFIDQVRHRTHSDKIDLIGHSEGGLIALYYVKNLAGASKVHHVIAMAPPTYGTDFNGLLSNTAGREIVVSLVNGISTVLCPACLDMSPTSELIRTLTTGPIAMPGVQYTIIATRYDNIVTPIEGQFVREPGVRNYYVQDFCASDKVEHGQLPIDPVVGQIMDDTLNPAAASHIGCGGR